MNFLLVALGTGGDIRPCIRLGGELRRRGHTVILAGPEHYQELAEAAGLDFASVLSRELYDDALSNPDFWHPRRFFGVVLQGLMVPATRPIVELGLSLPRNQEWRLVSTYLALPATCILQELLDWPRFCLWFAPAGIVSLEATPLICGWEWVTRMPRWIRWLFYRLNEVNIDRLVGPALREVRVGAGLTPAARVLAWMQAGAVHLWLFPRWFAAPAADWPTPGIQTGFLLGDEEALASELEAFLAAGPPPAVVTFGTGQKHGQASFRQAVAACRSLNLRVVVVSPHLPPTAPEADVFQVATAPFGALFARARVVIHHGGVGTAAQALAAGIPQLLVPMAHDQPDNAARLEALGAGLNLGSDGPTDMRTRLGRLLAQESPCARAANGLDLTCEALLAHYPGAPVSGVQLEQS